MVILEYKQWRRFKSVIDKAIQACENSGISVFEHFANVGKLSTTTKPFFLKLPKFYIEII